MSAWWRTTTVNSDYGGPRPPIGRHLSKRALISLLTAFAVADRYVCVDQVVSRCPLAHLLNAHCRPVVVIQAFEKQTFNELGHLPRVAGLCATVRWVSASLYPPYTLQTPLSPYSAPNAHTVHSAISISCTYAWGHNHGGPSHSGGGPRHTAFRYAHGLAINNGARGYGGES